jgi:hypothetical protein
MFYKKMLSHQAKLREPGGKYRAIKAADFVARLCKTSKCQQQQQQQQHSAKTTIIRNS